MEGNDLIPAWAKSQTNYRRDELTEEQAQEIVKRVRALSWFPRYAGAFLLVAGVGSLMAAIVGAPPSKILWIVLTIQFLFLGGIFRLIVFVRWGRIPAALKERKLEPRRGLVTGTFGFSYRSPGPELVVGLNHRMYKVLPPSVPEKYALQEVLTVFKEKKIQVIAYALPRTNLLVSFEVDQGVTNPFSGG